ncbi:MAG TPA: hypothetical protein VFH31_15285 [Pyrinomonadaceae bacterium]|nr:hypothetical protein [Pyrinomonadaceae bacterium]
MTSRRIYSTILFTLLFVVGITIHGSIQGAFAQSSDQPDQTEKRSDETNLDTQLHLLIASNQDSSDTKLPASLDPVLKQLRASLPFKNYRLATTLFNRVRNEGRIFLQWTGGPLIGSAAATAATPGFNEFKVNGIKLVTDAEGRQIVRMDGFRFGARIPIQTGTAIASNTPSAPIINYENTGLNTDISMREGEPVIVGTMNVGPSGEAIIVVVSARRSTN